MSDPRRPLKGRPVFFIDRCLGTGIVPEALREAGVQVEILDDHFSQGEADLVWLPAVGARGWAVLTEDKRIRTRVLELAALIQANTHVFILRPVKALTGKQKAAAFAKAQRQMEQIIQHRATPLLATVTPAGVVSELQGYSELQNQLQSLGWSP